MRTYHTSRIALLAVVGLSLLLAGCNTLESVTGDLLGDVLGGGPAASSPPPERAPSDGDDAPEFAPYAPVGMPPGVIFQLAFGQTYLITGTGYDPAAYEVGEGLHWRLTFEDDGGAEQILENEHALLAREGSDTWWLLVFRSPDFSIHYEFRVDADDVVREIRYQDREDGPVQSAVVSMPIGDYDSTRGIMEAPEDLESTEGITVQRTQERITVGAGTFDTMRVHATGTDPETGELVDASWWLSDDVPENTVQFDLRGEDGARYQGELIAYRNDYRRRF